jgi:hypothetical protein
MIASIIAYALCLFCAVFSVCSVVLSYQKKGTECLIAFAFVFIFGMAAWGFAYLGSLT